MAAVAAWFPCVTTQRAHLRRRVPVSYASMRGEARMKKVFEEPGMQSRSAAPRRPTFNVCYEAGIESGPPSRAPRIISRGLMKCGRRPSRISSTGPVACGAARCAYLLLHHRGDQHLDNRPPCGGSRCRVAGVAP